MFRDFTLALVTVVASAGAAQAHDYLFFAGGPRAYAHSGHTVSYHSVSVTPAVYAAPVVVHQPAYIVPTSVSYVSYPSIGHRRPPASVATYSHVFAPTVPTLATYYSPRYTQSHFVRHRPRGVDVRIRVR